MGNPQGEKNNSNKGGKIIYPKIKKTELRLDIAKEPIWDTKSSKQKVEEGV